MTESCGFFDKIKVNNDGSPVKVRLAMVVKLLRLKSKIVNKVRLQLNAICVIELFDNDRLLSLGKPVKESAVTVES